MFSFIDIILPVFLVMGFGYLVVWKGWFAHDSVDALMGFVQKFAIPCLLFSAMSTIDLAQNFDMRLMFSFYSGAFVVFALAFLGAKYVFGRGIEDSVTIGFVGMYSNALLLGIPITERAYGPEALEANYAILAIHSPIIYGFGIAIMETLRAKGKGGKEIGRSILRAMFRNTIVIGVALGLIVNLSGLPLPTAVIDAVDLIKRSALPAALFGLGGILVRYRPEGDMRTIIYVVALSLIVHPTITYTLTNAFDLSVDTIRSATLTAAMASGVNAYIYANMYDSAKRVAASTVLIGTVGSILSIGIWLTILP